MTVRREPDSTGIPRPDPSGLTGEWYAHLRAHELRFQRCLACRTWRHVPQELCPECRSEQFAWEASGGRGRIYSWTTTVRPLHPAFDGRAPYSSVVVTLDEGVRLLSSVTGVSPPELRMDLAVQAWFDDLAEGFTVCRFRVAHDATTALVAPDHRPIANPPAGKSARHAERE